MPERKRRKQVKWVRVPKVERQWLEKSKWTLTQQSSALHLRAPRALRGGRRWNCSSPGPGGRWSRGSRVHCPREGAMFLPPRHSQMAARGAGPKRTNDPWPEEQGGAVQGGGAPARVGPPPRPRPRTRTRGRPGEGRAPRATVPGSAPPNPWSVGARREIMPSYGLGRRRAGRVGLLSSRSVTAEQREADSGPSTSEASGRPSLVRPDPLYSPLARLRAFSGLWK